MLTQKPGTATATARPLTLPDYDQLQEIGSGAMGVVYKARQVRLQRTVALKMIRGGAHAGRGELARFGAEALMVAQVQHPNVVQVYEVGEHQGNPFIALEYVEGGTLADRLDGTPWKPEDAATLVQTLARAVDFAHDKGVIHRDLKPANILLQRNPKPDPRAVSREPGIRNPLKGDTPKITDFGLAKQMDSAGPTVAGQIMGTPSYMAPEQAEGHTDKIGRGTDVYALGSILYECLTGRPPFKAATALDTVLQVVSEEPAPPRVLNRKIPRDLETVCLKCLHKSPGRRYATAGELAEDLGRYLRHEPIKARPVGAPERAWRWARRHPSRAAVVAVALVAAVALLGGWAWFHRQLKNQLAQTEEARRETQMVALKQAADRLDRDLRQVAAVPQVMAATLAQRPDWNEGQLQAWMPRALETNPQVYGTTVAFEPRRFDPAEEDFALYAYRQPEGVVTKRLRPPKYDYRGMDWYKHPQERGATWTDPFYDEGGGDIPMLTYAVPLERDGKFVGVVTADLSVEYFRVLRDWLKELTLDKGGYAFVLTRTGRFVSHPDARFSMDTTINKAAEFQADPALRELARRTLGGETGRLVANDPATGSASTFLFTPVAFAGWTLVVVIPGEDVGAPSLPPVQPTTPSAAEPPQTPRSPMNEVMNLIGLLVITAVLLSAVAGAVMALARPEHPLGKEFREGIYSIGPIFLPVAGIMASIPFLAVFVKKVIGPAFSAIGADPAMAVTSVIAVDMGGYQLAFKTAESPESWIMAMLTGYMAGATIVFSIPVGLGILQKRDHKYMALGVMSGLLSIPVGVFVASLLVLLLNPVMRKEPSVDAPADLHLTGMSLLLILRNLTPLILFVTFLALGLRFLPDLMIRGFMLFGRVMTILTTAVLVGCIIQYSSSIFLKPWFNGQGVFDILFSRWLGPWGFDPIVADTVDTVRALEVAGYIGLMLAGAFPMIYLIKKYLAQPVGWVGRKLGLTTDGAAGILGAAANILAMFHLIKTMPPKDKVLCIAFGVCSAFLFGDHLAFTANFQPNLLLPVMAGKLTGGVFAFFLAYWLSVPKAQQLEKQDMVDDVKALASELLGVPAEELKIAELGGGLTNRNFRVDGAGKSYVVRVAGEGTGLLGIDRQREVSCSRAASEAGVGPAVIDHRSEPRQMLVLEFVKGNQLTEEDAKKPETLRRLGQTLRKCHDHPAPPGIGTFSAFETIRTYHDLARERRVPLPHEVADALAQLATMEAALKTDDHCLCHNDLLAGNFIDAGEATFQVIDWEYGGLGDRFFDLGNFAVNHQLTPQQEQVFLEAYFGAPPTAEQLRRLRQMRRVSDLREAMWGFLQAGVSRLNTPQYYLDYGKKHLDRFLAG